MMMVLMMIMMGVETLKCEILKFFYHQLWAWHLLFHTIPYENISIKLLNVDEIEILVPTYEWKS